MKKIIAFVLCYAVFMMSGCNQNNREAESSKTPLQGNENTITSSENTEETRVEAPKEEFFVPVEPEPTKKDADESFDHRDSGDAVSEKVIYQGSEIESFYAVDTENYLMAEMKDPLTIKKIISDFEKIDYNREDFNGYGFFLLNGDGKQYHYLHNSDPELSLTQNAVASLTNSKLHPSWLIHFTPERVISVNDVTDKEKIAKFCDFLKKEVTAEKMTSVLETATPANPEATTGDFFFRIKFDSDVSYTINGIDDGVGTRYISIYTSDLKKTVSYKLDLGVASKIKEFLGDFS